MPTSGESLRKEEGDSFWLGFVSSMSRSANPWSVGTTEAEAAGEKLHDAVIKPVSTAFMETGAKILVASMAVIVGLSFCAFLIKRCYAKALTSVFSSPQTASPLSSQASQASHPSHASQGSQTPPILPPKPKLPWSRSPREPEPAIV